MKIILQSPISHSLPNVNGRRGQAQLMIMDTVPSTNTWCKENIKTLSNGDIVAALKQTKGRGRFKRKWFSSANKSITMSAVIAGSLYNSPACLGLSAALAVASFLKELGLKPELKWPNDVIVNGHKISGILLESADHGMIVLGIGININTTRREFCKNGLGSIATSVKAVTGRHFNCMMLLPILINALSRELQAYKKKGLKHIIDSWTKNDFLKDKRIKVSQPDRTISGKYAALSSDGFLLIRTDKGRTEEVTSGDISIFASH